MTWWWISCNVGSLTSRWFEGQTDSSRVSPSSPLIAFSVRVMLPDSVQHWMLNESLRICFDEKTAEPVNSFLLKGGISASWFRPSVAENEPSQASDCHFSGSRQLDLLRCSHQIAPGEEKPGSLWWWFAWAGPRLERQRSLGSPCKTSAVCSSTFLIKPQKIAFVSPWPRKALNCTFSVQWPDFWVKI